MRPFAGGLEVTLEVTAFKEYQKFSLQLHVNKLLRLSLSSLFSPLFLSGLFHIDRDAWACICRMHLGRFGSTAACSFNRRISTTIRINPANHTAVGPSHCSMGHGPSTVAYPGTLIRALTLLLCIFLMPVSMGFASALLYYEVVVRSVSQPSASTGSLPTLPPPFHFPPASSPSSSPLPSASTASPIAQPSLLPSLSPFPLPSLPPPSSPPPAPGLPPLPPRLPNTSLPCATLLDQLTPPKSTCPGRTRPLLIMAGDGKTGTSTYAWAARELGLATGHWDEFLCPDSMGIAECTRREHAWTSFRRAIWALKPSELATFDYCGALKDLDAVADVPIPQLMPFLYAAHEDARVVLTVQNSVEWYRQRAQEHHGVHAAPFHWMMERSLSQIYPIDTGGARLEQLERRAVQSPSVASVGWAASQYGLGAAWSYVTEMALTMCTVPPSRNLRQASRTRS